jgi:hypothetical protein
MTAARRRELACRAADASWEHILAGADLTDADPAAADGLFAGMACFYWHFTYPEPATGIRAAWIHKVLQLKRPALYPSSTGT